MITKKIKVQTYLEHAICECGGELLPVPEDPNEVIVDIAVWPPRPKTYAHICDKCNKKEFFLEKYPILVHEEVDYDKNMD